MYVVLLVLFCRRTRRSDSLCYGFAAFCRFHIPTKKEKIESNWTFHILCLLSPSVLTSSVCVSFAVEGHAEGVFCHQVPHLVWVFSPAANTDVLRTEFHNVSLRQILRWFIHSLLLINMYFVTVQSHTKLQYNQPVKKFQILQAAIKLPIKIVIYLELCSYTFYQFYILTLQRTGI